MNFVFQTLFIETDFQNQLRVSLDDCERNQPDGYCNCIRHYSLESLDKPLVVEKLKKDNPDEWCPVGTIEFCEKWFTDVCGLPYCKPRNLPECLFKYRGGMDSPSNKFQELMSTKDRDYINIVKDVKCFVKSNEIIKHPRNGVFSVKELISEFSPWNGHDIQVSVLEDDIVSEWRAFIFHGKIIDIRPYVGDPFAAPSKLSVMEFVDEIQKSDDRIPSYTLDVFVTKNGRTKPLEMHDFFSCGLYGFQSHLYPAMLTQWFFYYKNKCRNLT